MKKFFTMILVLVAAFALVACGGAKEFKQDGEFTAFTTQVHRGAPQYTSVTVTIKDGKIESFFIDCLQGTATKNEDGEFTALAWNEKTKKELGFGYKMHWAAFVADTPAEADQTLKKYEAYLAEKGLKEWHQQAALIEAELLAKGADKVTDVAKIAGVTIKDGGYLALAKEAVANAKAGKSVAFSYATTARGAEFYWVTTTFEKGKATEVVVDTLQSKIDKATGLVWNEKSKQELGFEYKMHWPQFVAATPEVENQTIEKYQTWLKENQKLEWFEQVAIISKDIVDNGLKAQPATPLAGVTVTTDTYYTLIAEAFKAVGIK